MFGWARSNNTGAVKSYLGSGVHRAGMDWAKWNVGFGKYAGKGAGRLLGPAFTLYEAYQGYKKGGAWGAAKGAGQSIASSYAFGAAAKLVGAPLKAVGLGVAAGAQALAGVEYLTKGVMPFQQGSSFGILARPFVADRMRRHSELELGRPIVDQFGTLATMRQRSLAAIQNSKINGRSALGNEATLMYQPYFR